MSDKIVMELDSADYLKVCSAVRMRAQTCHNLADEYMGTDAGREYRIAGNTYAKLLAKLQEKLPASG